MLLQSLAEGFNGSPQRRAMLDVALAAGLPGQRGEAWKYTSLRALDRRSFDATPSGVTSIDPTLLATIPSPRMVFVNGQFDIVASRIDDLPAGLAATAITPGDDLRATPRAESDADLFLRLNAALAEAGVGLAVETGTHVAVPLHLVFVGAPSDRDQAWHLRHHISLGEGAALTVMEHHIDVGAHRHLDNSVLRIDLAAHAHLTHARVQSGDEGATSVLRTDATLGTKARYERLDLELGGALSRHELNVRLQGNDARVFANGVLLAAGKRHLDTRLGIEHVARDTVCELLWRGIGAGRGRVVFHGGITIHAGADGSDARLSNKNLLLGMDAEVDTQPVLVIHADEVKAAHGATVGQLDPTALFYLRTRGLPEADARRLLTTAFVAEPLGVIAAPDLRAMLQAHVDRALAALPAP